MADSATWDTIAAMTLRFIRDPGLDTVVLAEYVLTTATGTHPLPPRSVPLPLNAARQTQANGIMDAAVAFIKTREALP